MSLDIALNNALTGLRTVQQALQTTSNNVSNANTEGYTRKSAQQVALVLAGQGAGVDITDVTRQVNDALVKQLRNYTSTLGQLNVNSDYFTRTQQIFGTLTSNSSLTAGLSDLSTTLQALATTPEDPTRQAAAITSAVALAQRFNDSSTSIQQLRTEADQDISESVNAVNLDLSKIADLNHADRARTTRPTCRPRDLLDQRDLAMNDLAQQMDFTTFTRSNGEVVIVTGGGRVLLDGTAPTLTHTAVSAADPARDLSGRHRRHQLQRRRHHERHQDRARSRRSSPCATRPCPTCRRRSISSRRSSATRSTRSTTTAPASRPPTA